MARMLYVCICLLMLLQGCAGHKKIKPVAVVLHEQEVIAKCVDLPDAPFQAHLEKIAMVPEQFNQLQLFYTTSMPMADVILLYQQQMERLGWNCIGQSYVDDCLLCYSKPTQLCSVLIRPHSFVVYLCEKKEA